MDLGQIKQALEDSVQRTGQDGHFRLRIPVLDLPGRGISLNLALYYNSQLWIEADSGIHSVYYFDPLTVGDYLPPGWTLGFGRMIPMEDESDCQLIGADGDPLRGEVTDRSTAGVVRGRTTDGSFVEWEFQKSQATTPPSGTAWYPDGTVVNYAAYRSPNKDFEKDGRSRYTGYGLYPVQITDRNGNWISISYVNDEGPAVDVVDDTTGRRIQFVYSKSVAHGQIPSLEEITAPDGTGGVSQVMVMDRQYVQAFFPFVGSSIPPLSAFAYIETVTAIYLPGDLTGYAFEDYSSYGIIRRVSRQQEMVPPTNTTLGAKGTTVESIYYDFPTRPDLLNPLPSVPTFTNSTRTVLGAAGEATEHIEVSMEPGRSIVRVKTSDGIITETVKTVSANWDAALPLSIEHRIDDGSGYGSAFERVEFGWGKGEWGAPVLREQKFSTFRGGRNQSLVIERDYGPFNRLLSEKLVAFFPSWKEKDPPGGPPGKIVKTTQYEYAANPDYEKRHLLRLLTRKSVQDGTGNFVEQTTFDYDLGGDLALTPIFDISQHHTRFEPGTLGYDELNNLRGNLSRVLRFVDPGHPTSSLVETTYRYDAAGNLLYRAATGEPSLHIEYDQKTAAFPLVSIIGDPNGANWRESRTFNPGTGLVLTHSDARGTTSYTYDSAGRPLEVSRGKAKTTYNRGTTTTGSYTNVSTLLDDQTVYDTHSYFNGAGKPLRREYVQEYAQDSTTYVAQLWEYDVSGRLTRFCDPFNTAQADTWHVNTTQADTWHDIRYDERSRLVSIHSTSATESSDQRYFYDEDVAPPVFNPEGMANWLRTVREVTPSGHQKWVCRGLGGRLECEVSANPERVQSSIYDADALQTRYINDDLNRVIEIVNRDAAGTPASRRKQKFDGLGRLVAEACFGKDRSLSETGAWSAQNGPDKWTDVYQWASEQAMASHTDSRGVRTKFSYENGALARLNGVTWDVDARQGEPHEMREVPEVTYSYNPVFPQMITQVSLGGIPVEEYLTDSAGRLTKGTYDADNDSTRLVWSSQSDELDRTVGTSYSITSAKFPNINTVPQRNVVFTYGPSGPLSSALVTSVGGAREIRYDAQGRLERVVHSVHDTDVSVETWNYAPPEVRYSLQDNRNAAAPVVLADLTATLGPQLQGRRPVETVKVDGNTLRSFSYDSAGRITETGGYGWSVSYAQGIGGELEGSVSQGFLPSGQPVPIDGQSVAVDFGTGRITTPGFDYDQAGNITAVASPNGEILHYRYDFAGRLASVSNNAGVIREYQYGADWRLRSAVSDGERTLYFWAGSEMKAELKLNGLQLDHTRLHHGKQGIFTLTEDIPEGLAPQVTTWCSTPFLGAGFALTDDKGARPWQTLPFGNDTSGDPSQAAPFYFDYLRDERTGLFYAGFRFYSPGLGRFLTPDPIPAELLRGRSLSGPYSLAGNDPVNRRDPFGLAEDQHPEHLDEDGFSGGEHGGIWITRFSNIDGHQIGATTYEPPSAEDIVVTGEPIPQSLTNGADTLPGSPSRKGSDINVKGAGAGGATGRERERPVSVFGAISIFGINITRRLLGASLTAAVKIGDAYRAWEPPEYLEQIVEANAPALPEEAETAEIIASKAAVAEAIISGAASSMSLFPAPATDKQLRDFDKVLTWLGQKLGFKERPPSAKP